MSVMDENKLELKENADNIVKRIGLTIVVLLLFGFIGWMNRYRYDHVHTNEGRDQIARINRYTEQICYSQNDGSWNSNRYMAVAQQEANDLPTSILDEATPKGNKSPPNLCQ